MEKFKELNEKELEVIYGGDKGASDGGILEGIKDRIPATGDR